MIKFRSKKFRPNFVLDHTIKKIAEIVCGTPYKDGPLESTDIFKNDDKWVLSGANDHWLRLENEDDEFRYWRLDYRYITPKRQEAFDGVALWLEYKLGAMKE